MQAPSLMRIQGRLELVDEQLDLPSRVPLDVAGRATYQHGA